MAANRLESAPDVGNAREPAAVPPAPPSAPGGFKAWLPLIVTAVAMPLLAYAVTTFVLLPKLQKGLDLAAGDAGARTEGGKPGSPSAAGDQKTGPEKEIVSLNKLLVNVAGTMGSRYLLCTVALAGSDADFKAKVTRHDPQLKDAAMGILMTKTIADIEKPGARNTIRAELISSFNNILGGPVVEDLYFTEFAIQ